MADTTVKLRADITQLKSQMQAAARQVKVANSEFKAASAGMEDWSKNAVGLEAKLKQLSTILKSQKTQLSLLETEYEKTKELYGENSAAADRVKISLNNMKAAVAKTESDLNKYNSELEDCKNEEGKFSKAVDDSTESMEETTKATEQMSDGFTVAKGVLADLVATGIKAAVNGLKDLATGALDAYKAFDEGQDIIIMKTGATGEAIDELSENYVNVMKTVLTESETAGNAIGTIATKFGVTGEELEKLSTKFIKFAELNNTDVATSIEKVQSAAAAWDVETENVGDLLDLLNKTAQKTGASVDGLAGSLTSNAASLKDMNFNLESAVSFMGNLETVGVDSGVVMAALKKALANAAKEGKSTADALSELQNNMSNAESKTDATVAAMELFGAKAAPAIAEACQSGRLNFNDLSKAMTDYQGNVDETYENTFDGFDKIKLAFQGVKMDVGAEVGSMLDDISPEIEEVVKLIEDEAKNAISYVKDNAPAIKTKIKDVIEFTKNGITWIIENFGDLKETAKTVGTILIATFAVNKLVAFIQSIGTMISTFTALKTATETATTAQLLLNAAQAATPVGLVAAGVAALAAGIVYLATKTKDYTNEIEGLTEWEQNEIDKVYELKDSYQALKESRDEAVQDVQTEFDHYQKLAGELDNLVDKNGEVKEADQDRANFIISTLNEALGTEIEMVDGVIQNYNEEKAAIESLMETKRAQAILSANEEAYTSAIENQKIALDQYTSSLGIYNQNKAELADLEERYNKIADMTSAEYAKANDLLVSETTAAEMLAQEQQELINKMNGAKEAIVLSKTAYKNAEDQYIEYQTTIKNYEGLSSAIISGDAEKIKIALSQMVNDFITAETGSKEALEQQVADMEANYNDLKKAVESGSSIVTKEMVDEAAAMVKAAKAELDKLPDEASSAANKAASNYATTFGSDSNLALAASNAGKVRDSAKNGLEPDGSERTAGENFVTGYVGGIEVKIPDAESAASGVGNSSTRALNSSIGAQSPSKETYSSGEYFGQGFINGMNSKKEPIWQTAWNLAKHALAALRKGQQEGSPSKLTFQSGQYFTQGYINGITSLQKDLVSTVKMLVQSAVKTASDVSNYDFVNTASGVAQSLADSLSASTSYMLNKISYENEKKVKEFDTEITTLQTQRDKKKASIQSDSDKKIAKLEKKKNATSDKAAKTKLEKQITQEKKNAQKLIKAEETKYQKLIDTQNKYKTAYQDASKEFISEFSAAVNSYSQKAQDLINTTINGIADKYQSKYDELISKQDELINKLKTAGDLFNISNAGVFTISDLNEQTRQITEYTSKLAKIKERVSSELFDQIVSYDMKEGQFFIDQLLGMSTADLEAYNKAYTEKLKAAEKAGETIYSQDIKKVGEEYQKELDKALKNLPKQLEDLGSETMKGFVDGLTKNTDYMSKEVQTFVSSMIDTFKKDLGLNNNELVTQALGTQAGQGFVEGIKQAVSQVKDEAATIAAKTAQALELDKEAQDIANAVSARNRAKLSASNSTVTNNYNLVQNNTSPKSLSALDTYRARQQQISLLKAYVQ